MFFQRFPLVFVTLSLCLSVLSAPISDTTYNNGDMSNGVHSLATNYQNDVAPFHDMVLGVNSSYYRTEGGMIRKRAHPEAKTGDSITINGHTAKLGTKHSGASRGSGSTATFDVTWKGVAAIAKQQTTLSDAKFDEEVKHTHAASNAQGNGLFIEEGTHGGGKWMILKKVPGQDLLTLLLTQKPTKAVCEKYIQNASNLAADAQVKLAQKAGFVQGDDNFENYLFDATVDHVNVIDFGLVSAASSADKAKQLHTFKTVTFGPLLEIAQHHGFCK